MLLKVLLGQVPEAIFFALFMIYTKDLKEKRILFTILMVLEYLLLKQFISFNIWFQILYTIITYILLKILYKQKAQITDIFTFTIANIFLVIASALFSLPKMLWNVDYTLCVVLCRIFLFAMLFIFKNKLYNIQKIYKKLWNRNDKVEKKIKTTTFRSLNVILFNVIFYIINIGMLLATIWRGGN